MANAVVNRQVNVYINSGEAAKAYDVLIKREKLLNAELAKTTDPKRIKQLTAELDKLKDPIDRAAKKMKGDLAPSIRELELATRKFLNEFKKTGDPETLRKFQAFQAELNKAKLQLNDLGTANKGLTSMGIFKSAFWANLAAGGITAVMSKISGFFTSSVEEALAADQATTRLKNTLDNLGRSDAFDRITRKAQAMAERFSYLDNDDVVGVFNKLIDYGKLTEQQMNELLPVIIDFSAKSQISLEESASVIIKALAGNGKALKEYGINIKDAGTEADRLNMVLTTLKEKVDGSADAFMNSAQGGIATARQQYADLKEDIGNGLLPIMNKFLDIVSKTIKGVKALYQDLSSLITGEKRFGDIDQKVNTEVARSRVDQDINDPVFKRMKDDTKIANLQIWADYYQKLIKETNDKLAASKFEGNHGKIAADLNSSIELYKEIVKIYNDEIALIEKKDPLGIDPGGGDKENAELKKAIEERKKLLEELKKIEMEQRVFNISEIDKELALMEEKYAKLRERANGEAQILIKIEELYAKGRLQLVEKYVEKEVDAWKKASVGLNKSADETFKKNLLGIREIEKRLLANPEARFASFDRNREAGLQLQVAKTTGKAKLKAELDLLKEQERQELDAKGLTENEKLLIEEKFRIKRKEAENSYLTGYVENLANYARQALEIFNTIGQAQTNRENAELENDRRLNEKKKNNLDQRLKKGLISQQQFDREVQKIEKDQEKREKEVALKQFKRQQAADIGQAIINGALAVTSTLAAKPGSLDILSLGAFRAIQIGLAVATTAAQIATIASRKPPQFAQGGMLGGRSHSAGGNSVIDGSGRKIAEVEAGEGIVNKRTMADGRKYSVSGTPSQIISRLNGMYGSSWETGATLIPGWRSYSPQRMNYSAMKRMYADGGVMGSNSGNQGADNSVFENLTAMISDMQSTQAYLASVLANGIVADVSLNRFEQQQERLTAIRRDATLRG